MHGGAHPSLLPATPVLFSWARAGLLRFLELAADRPTAAEPLREAIAAGLTGYAGMHWQEIDRLLAEQVQRGRNGLAALVRDAAADLPRLYLFTLAAAIELDAATADLLPQVQGGRAGWLRVGTADALLRRLFPAAPVLDIPTCDLARHRLLLFDGGGPLVQQPLYTSADHWRALADGVPLPELTPIDVVVPAGDPETAAALAAAGLLGRGVALRTDAHAARAFTAALAERLGRRPLEVTHEDWRQRSVRAVCRLAGWLPLVDCREHAGIPIEAAEIDRQAVLLLRGDQQMPDGHIAIDLPEADPARRRHWWRRWLDDEALIEPLASARLSRGAVERIGGQLGSGSVADDGDLLRRVRLIRSADGSAHLKRVAAPVDTHIGDDLLVLADDTRAALERCHRRCLARDYAGLGMGATIRATAVPGVVLLFAGASGTGKTLAASWLASRLGAPLYRIDLAMVMNKYVGETEKNLSLALDEAARADVMLLFDEADALFGKRSDNTHGGERFANMLTNFLLSRIETHPGICVLTTNAGNRMDTAFLRRIDIAVEFRPLEAAHRLALWQRLLGGRAPTDAGLLLRISRHCDLAPGHVRNIVVNACCWNPGGEPLSAAALWEALDEEYRKASRSMPSQLMALRGRIAAADGDLAEDR